MKSVPICKHVLFSGLSDILSQGAGHFQSIYVIWGLLHDGVIRHEVSGSNPCVIGKQVHCAAIRCMATGGHKKKDERVRKGLNTETGILYSVNILDVKLPFSTLGVGVV